MVKRSWRISWSRQGNGHKASLWVQKCLKVIQAVHEQTYNIILFTEKSFTGKGFKQNEQLAACVRGAAGPNGTPHRDILQPSAVLTVSQGSIGHSSAHWTFGKSSAQVKLSVTLIKQENHLEYTWWILQNDHDATGTAASPKWTNSNYTYPGTLTNNTGKMEMEIFFFCDKLTLNNSNKIRKSHWKSVTYVYWAVKEVPTVSRIPNRTLLFKG